MITIKNTDTQKWIWYALPKWSADISSALGSGTLPPGGTDIYKTATTVNILFATPAKEVAAVCVASVDSTVVFYNPSFGAWCGVS